MNTGIQDAFNLSWKLASVMGMAQPEILDSYNASEHPVAEAIVKETDQGLHNAYQSKQLHRICAESVRVKRYPCRSSTKPTSYDACRNQHRIQGQSHCGRLRRQQWSRCGERAPDATIVKLPDKKTVRLFEVLRGTQWTLLLLSGHKATPYTYQSQRTLGKL